MSRTYPETTVPSPESPPTCWRVQVGKIEQMRIPTFSRICRCKTNGASYRAIRKKSVVGTKCSVGDGPLSERVVDGLVVSPFIGVRGVIHADFEVLGA